MFTRVEEIWWKPYEDKFKNGEEVPEIVRRVNEALFEVAKIYDSEMTDEELLLKGIDPDMVNEFCLFNQGEWPEMEKYYQDKDGMYTMDDAEMVGTKQHRAQLIWDGIDPETEQPIGYQEYTPTYEEWKASLGVGPQEFPHSLIGTDQPLDYVNRLIREHEMFQEMVMSQMDQY
jgi:hypothetical protein